MPVLVRMVSGGDVVDDLLEEVLELLSYMTYYAETLRPPMWALWPTLVRLPIAKGLEHFGTVLAPLDNFISKGTFVLLIRFDSIPKTHKNTYINNEDTTRIAAIYPITRSPYQSVTLSIGHPINRSPSPGHPYPNSVTLTPTRSL